MASRDVRGATVEACSLPSQDLSKSSQQPHEEGSIILFTLQMRKLNLLGQIHTEMEHESGCV